MLLTFLLTGLRRKELANIKAGDIQKRGEKLYLTYYIKGGTKIVRDLPVKCWTAIQAYLKVSGRVTNSNSPLFVAVNGPKDRNRKDAAEKVNIQTPLTPEAIRLIVKEYSARAFGNELKVSPHTLRHTAGTLLRKAGVPSRRSRVFETPAG
jgi:integrase